MVMKLLRRTVEVTSVPAPILGQPVDVESEDKKPTPPDVDTLSVNPTYEPGRCWHPVHLVLDGERFGVSPDVLMLTAALTKCHGVNPAGR